MGLVVDTSVLIALERSRIPLASLNLSEDLVLPAIVWAEVLCGVRLADTQQRAAARMASLLTLRNVVTFKPFTLRVAEHYADIYSEMAKLGTPIPQNDIAVAATARSLGYGVLLSGADEKHFRRVSGLRVVLLAP